MTNYNISETWSLAFSTDNLLEVKLSNLVTTLPFLSEEWRVSFTLFPLDLSDQGNWVNILHMTTGENNCCYGSRTPIISFYPPYGLLIDSAISGQNTVGVILPSPVLRVNTNIEITQESNEEGKIMYRVVIDDVEVYQNENTDPRVFENVAVYVPDPWYMSPDPNYKLGFVQDLSIYVKN